MANVGQQEFNARVKRIKSPRNTTYYDPELEMHVPKHTTHDAIRKNAKARKFSVVRLSLSVLIGVAAVMVAQAFRVRVLGIAESGIATLLIDVVLAWLVVLLITVYVTHRKITLRLAQTVGVVLMFVAGHNLMWSLPDQMALVYTQPYVDQVIASTEPASLVVGSTVFGLQ